MNATRHSFLSLEFRASTLFTLVAVLSSFAGTAAVATMAERLGVHVEVRAFVTFFLWPLSALTGAVTAMINLFKRRSVQFALEALLDTAMLVLLYVAATTAN